MQVKHCVLPALQAGAAQVAMDEKKIILLYLCRRRRCVNLW